MLTEKERLEIVRKVPTMFRKPLLYILEEIAEELHEIKTDVALLTEAVVEPIVEEAQKEKKEKK